VLPWLEPGAELALIVIDAALLACPWIDLYNCTKRAFNNYFQVPQVE